MNSVLEIARQYNKAGINLLPVRHDGTKAPAPEGLDASRSWKYLQTRMVTAEELARFFSNGNGIAAITGRISGFLEDLDFDSAPLFEPWKELVTEHLGEAFVNHLLIVQTPRPGYAVVYRCAEGIEGNQELARASDGKKTLIETRGEGGYFLLPGSPADCHPSGREYEIRQGDFDSIPEITIDERETMLACARSFDERTRVPFESETRDTKPDELLPGEDFNRRGPSVETLLSNAGWRTWKTFADKVWWTRPDKKTGVSGSSNGEYFYPFTTSTEFDANRAYGRFRVYAILEHGGDFNAAAKALYQQGYGTHHETREEQERREDEEIRALMKETAEEDATQKAKSADLFAVPTHWKWLDVANLSDWNCLALRWSVQDLIAQGNFVIIAAETQTGKTLFGLFLSHSMLHEGQLFGKLLISPIDKILYMGLEDPDRRFKERLLDVQHSFPAIESGRFIVHTAPDFTLTDEKMVAYLEHLIVTNGFKVVFLDTYQKATPGLTSFDDEKQAVILHRLSNLTRKHDVTIIVLDHVRKRDSKQKRNILAVDDIKGTGSKPQNADCIILAERTADRKQIKLQSFSKDSDQNVRILLDVSPKGSDGPKFKYAGDLEQLGADSKAKGAANRAKVLAIFGSDDRLSSSQVAEKTGLSEATSRTHLRFLVESGQLDSFGKGKATRYWLQSAEKAKG